MRFELIVAVSSAKACQNRSYMRSSHVVALASKRRSCCLNSTNSGASRVPSASSPYVAVVLEKDKEFRLC
jgi:hypothetical protein